jgi:hypothetical protein
VRAALVVSGASESLARRDEGENPRFARVLSALWLISGRWEGLLCWHSGGGGYASPGSSVGRGPARSAAPSAADGLRGLYARLAERYANKLDDNNCKQLFEYLKGA